MLKKSDTPRLPATQPGVERVEPEISPATVERSSATVRQISRFLIPVVLLIFATPFVILPFYSVPAADDFCNASLSFNTVPQSGLLSFTWAYYTQWSPRWLTYFLLGLSMSRGDLLHTYGWLLLVVALTNVASLWYFCSTAFRLSRTNSLLAAAAIYAAWIVTLGSPDQQLYWLSDVLAYNLSLSTLLVLLCLLLRPRPAAWYYPAVVLLSIAIPAQQEIAGAFLCMVTFLGTVFALARKLPARHWYVSLGSGGVSTAFVVLSPGNAMRAAAEHKHLWDIAHLPHWVGHSFYHGMDWLSLPAVLAGALCILMLCQSDAESRPIAGPPPRWLAAAGLCAMVVVLLECSLVEVATGSWLPDRVVMWFQFLFFLGFVCVVVAGASEIYRIKFSATTRLAVFGLFAVTLLGSSNFRSAVEDARGPAESWWRMEAARLSQRGGTLVYEAPVVYPRMAKPQMLGADPGCWVNQCVANYLHAEKVIVTNSREECPH